MLSQMDLRPRGNETNEAGVFLIRGLSFNILNIQQLN